MSYLGEFMTELQKCEFDLLKVVDEICNRLNIKYFLVCGSALGAVKYGGFIPWDDDIDIALFRDDYEIFISKAPSLLKKDLFLQNWHNEKYFLQIYSKLRNSNSTYIESSVSSFSINHGAFIDIFPLDEYPENKFRQCILELSKQYYYQRTSSFFTIKRSFKGKIIKTVFLLFKNVEKIPKLLHKYENILTKYKGKHSDIICNHGNWQGKLEYAPRSQYGDGAWFEFEGLKVRVPEKYDEYLTQKYGDWRADLPEEQQVGHHYYEVCDLNRPYTDYIEKLPNGKIKIKKPE